MGAYNAEPYIAAAIESILGQEFGDFELLIVDDGSTDRTRAIAEGYAARDPRMRIISEMHRGHVKALNQLLLEAGAPLIARADADDVCRITRFGRQVAFLDSHPDYGVVGCEMDFIDATGAPLPKAGPDWVHDHEDMLRILSEGPPFAHPTVMMRREVVLAVGGYREAFDPAEDYDLWLRLSGRTKFANLPERLVQYRVHPDQLSQKCLPEQTRSAAIAQLAHKARMTGLADPTEGLTTLPASEELDVMFGPGAARYVNRRIFEAARYSLDHVTGGGWEGVLAHAAESPSRHAFRVAARLLLAGKVAAAARLCAALVSGFLRRGGEPSARKQTSRSA